MPLRRGSGGVRIRPRRPHDRDQPQAFSPQSSGSADAVARASYSARIAAAMASRFALFARRVIVRFSDGVRGALMSEAFPRQRRALPPRTLAAPQPSLWSARCSRARWRAPGLPRCPALPCGPPPRSEPLRASCAPRSPGPMRAITFTASPKVRRRSIRSVSRCCNWSGGHLIAGVGKVAEEARHRLQPAEQWLDVAHRPGVDRGDLCDGVHATALPSRLSRPTEAASASSKAAPAWNSARESINHVSKLLTSRLPSQARACPAKAARATACAPAEFIDHDQAACRRCPPVTQRTAPGRLPCLASVRHQPAARPGAERWTCEQTLYPT